MDVEKARTVYRLYARMDDLRSSILTLRSRFEKNPSGTTNVTIPTSWLPEVIAIAERELEKVNEQIDKL